MSAEIDPFVRPSCSHARIYIYIYLLFLGHIAAKPTGPCQGEIISYQWRLTPGQGSGVRAGGGKKAAEHKGDWESAGVRLSILAAEKTLGLTGR